MNIVALGKLCLVIVPVLVAPASVSSSMPTANALPLEECPLTCEYSFGTVVWDTDFIVTWSGGVNGYGKPQTCATCEVCKGTIGWAYLGTRRWRITTPSGVTMGIGQASGAQVVSSTCDDETPGGVAGEVGQNYDPGFIAQLYCYCIG